jgi:hypothetical protein
MPNGAPAQLATTATRATAIGVGKSIRYLSRALGRGGGTVLPGSVANRLDRGLLTSLVRPLPNGCALVTGTNGKTTTTRILAEAARAAGLHVITNREGSITAMWNWSRSMTAPKTRLMTGRWSRRPPGPDGCGAGSVMALASQSLPEVRAI